MKKCNHEIVPLVFCVRAAGHAGEHCYVSAVSGAVTSAQQSLQSDGGEVLPPHKHTYIDGYCACGVSITRRR